jgi:hypothetical protein
MEQLLFWILIAPNMADAEKQAIETNRPVLVCRNCEPLPGNWICYRAMPDDDVTPLIIVCVVRGGKLVLRAWVNPDNPQVIANVLR